MANYGHMLVRCVWQDENPEGQIFEVPVHDTFETFVVDLSQRCEAQIVGLLYVDEEQELIRAEDEDDYHAMVDLYEWMQKDPTTCGPITVRLEVKKRNKFDLTIDVGAAEPAEDGAGPAVGLGEHLDVGQLGVGEILESDLEYGDMLGSGSGGTVYRTLHKPTRITMAVKVIPIDASPDVQRHILEELEILYRCDSPYIIRYYGSFFNENRIMLCTEFMDGPSLDQICKIGSMPEHILGRVIVAVLQGLVYLQELKIMHRDIKPSNILVNSAGAIKLCDFGVSTQLQQSMTATYVGTNAYMAPERVQGHPYTVRSEVWSLGLTLVELAIGRFPYPADSESGPIGHLPIDLLQCIVHEPPPQLPKDAFSPEFCDFTAQCLNHSADKRPTPSEIMKHPLVQHYSHFTVGEDPEFAQWIHDVLQHMDMSPHLQAAVATVSPVPGSFPPVDFS
eukprot:m.93695 g.93695  ORF g.93695 m.93695 type:complete len:449 (-) comp10012_c0_seq2:109-1455(-)